MSKYLAEAIATFALVFVGAAAVLAGTGTLAIAFAHGLVLAVMIYAIAHISGAHINPAVSIAMWATKRMKGIEAAKYVISQLIGASVAAVILTGIYGNVAPAVNNLAPGVSVGTGLLVEIILTFFLVFVIFATVVDKRSNSHHAALAIGFVLIFDHIIGLSITGSSMNPARTFGPALASGMWANHLVYWVGPILGALVAAYLYQTVFLKKKRKR
ncbi:MAG TPA: MIP/aquaporin family protein [archaeon]|nr:MIP/aquaporin family protein [archaeon]